MNRMHKKCFIGSAGVHLLLVVILFVGPLLLSAKSKPDNTPILDFVPYITVDSLMSGGGSATAKPPPAAPPAPPVITPPQPAPEPKHDPEPEKEQPKPEPPKIEPPKTKTEVDSLEPSK